MALVRNFRLPIGIGISADYIETFGIIESGDTNTGSVVARGGAGIAGTLNVGGNINLHYGNYYTGFKSSSTANTVYTLPSITPAFGSSVLTSNPTGLMHWDDVHALLNIDRATYGSFYSNQAQQVIGADTATPITLNGTYESYKVSIFGGSGTSSRIKIDTAGTYNIQFSAQVNLVSGSQPQKGDFWFRIDGVNVPESNTRMSILGKDYETVIALNFVYTFDANQYFELVMSSSDSNWLLARDAGITNPTRPGIPSIILSVTPVAETVGGSGSGSTGILSINGLNSGQQYIDLGSSGTLPNIDSSGFTHTINIPIASSGSTGLISTNAQTIAGSKTFSSAIIGNLSGTSTTSQNLNTVSATTGTGHYLLFSPVNGGSGVAVSSDTQLQFSPSTNILTVDTLSGNLSGTAATVTNFYGTLTGNVTGTATTSENVNVTTTTRSLTHYLTFTNQSSGSGLALTTSAIGIGFTVNPAQNTLAAGTFVGNLSGTAATTGILKVTSTSGTALNIADRVTVNTVDNFEGLNINSNYSYALSVQDKANNHRFTVDVQNNKTYFYGSSADHELRIYNSNQSAYTGFKANSTGTITYILPPGKPSTGSSILQSDDSGNMIWVPMTSGLSSAITSINSQTGPSITLQTGVSGTDFAISQSANTITFDIPDASASNRGLVTTGTQTIAGSKTFSSTISGNLSGTATSSQNVNTAAFTNNSVHYLTFTLTGTGAGAALSTSNVAGKLTYRPADEQLSVTNITGTAFTATNFYGSLAGNVTGTATTSQNVNTNVYTNNSVHYLTFTLQGNGAGAALSTSNSAGKLTYRPADEQLSVTNITGTAFTATNFYGTLTGNVTGTATSSQNVNTATFTNNNVHFLTFTLQGNGAGAALSTSNVSGKLTYRPTDEQLSVTFITGTAFTATNLTGTILTSSQTNITALGTITTGTWNATAISTAKGGTGQDFSSASGLIKLASGTASNIANPTAASIGISYLTADTDGNIHWKDNTQVYNGLQYDIAYYNRTGQGVTGTNGVLTFYDVENTKAITVTSNFSGAFTVRDTANNNRFTVDVQNNKTYFSGNSADHELRIYNSNQSSYTGFKANSTGTVTYILPPGKPSTGSSILQSDDSGNMIWVPMTTGGLSNAVTSINSQTGPSITLQTGSSGNNFAISQSANIITFDIPDASESNRGLVTTGSQTFAGTKTFSSTISGNISGTATTSQNVNVNTTTRNQNHYLIFSNRSSGSGVALTTSTIGIGFTVNPAENTLSAGLFAGNISGTGATFARATFTDDTEATNQTTGSVTFAGGIAVNKKVFAQSVETNGNVIVNGNFQTYGSIIQLGNSGTADTIGFICKIQSVMLPQSNNAFDIGLNDGTHAWKNAAFAGHGTFANLYGTTSANLTGVQFSGGDVLIRSGKSVKFYEANDVYNTSIKANSSIAGDYTYTLPLATPGTGASILQSDTTGSMIWVKAASNKATYVLSFGAGFTPTTGLDSVSIAIPYANDGSTSLIYTIKRVDVRTETAPGASTLAFYFERHTAGDATWASANTIKGAASANFSVASTNFASSFTTITSSSGNNGEVSSGNYLRVNFASVGSAANVSISIMIQEN